MSFIRWRRAGVIPDNPQLMAVRRLIYAELTLFAFLLAFAAAMARGYGPFQMRLWVAGNTSRGPDMLAGPRLYGSGMHAPPIARWLIPRLPFFYGWVILGCACCAGLSRQGGAVATLSVFVAPMTSGFGWSRTAISGAVSLGGILAAIASPWLGRLLDREGARLVLCVAVLTTGLANMALSLTASLPMFYLLFCIARLNFAGPFDLGIYGAVNSWFITRRSFASGIASVGQMTGLVVLPMIASLAMLNGRLAGGMAGDRRHRPGGRVRAVLPVAGPLARGCRPDSGRPSGHPTRCGGDVPSRSSVHPCPGDADEKLLAVVVVYVACLSSAGGGQPASGTLFDRARPQHTRRSLHRQLFLADVGDRRFRVRSATEGFDRALETGTDRAAAVCRRDAVLNRSMVLPPAISPRRSSALVSVVCSPCCQSPGVIISGAATMAPSAAWL